MGPRWDLHRLSDIVASGWAYRLAQFHRTTLRMKKGNSYLEGGRYQRNCSHALSHYLESQYQQHIIQKSLSQDLL